MPKSQQQKDSLKQRLTNAFMFKALDETELNIVIDAMEEKKLAEG